MRLIQYAAADGMRGAAIDKRAAGGVDSERRELPRRTGNEASLTEMSARARTWRRRRL